MQSNGERISNLIEDKMTATRHMLLARDAMLQAQQACEFYQRRIDDLVAQIVEIGSPETE